MSDELDLVLVHAAHEREFGRTSRVDGRFGDDRDRVRRFGVGLCWLHGGGHHQHSGDETSGGELEAGNDRKVDRLTS
ncbi:MAG TPA: hypothetical protein PKA98_15670, partial [Acidimicrobiales bacterium]|nr:hypothetical protein [Acidimicrobiales bacterium]